MMPKVTRYLLSLCVWGFLTPVGHATTLCTETASGATAGDQAGGLQQGGCVATVYHGSSNVVVASDAEVNFDPFGAGFATSDGVNFNVYASVFIFDGQAGWQQLSSGAWVLPEGKEALGHWTDSTANTSWGGQEGTYTILEANGAVSDTITLDDLGGPNHNQAEITFQSDIETVPEPSTVLLLGIGLLGGMIKLRSRFHHGS